MDPFIHDRGRGPEIVGSRITVYDVIDYASTRTPEFIAELFSLKVEQIRAALEYIDEHRDEVMVEYRKMLARAEAGNPPEVQAKLDQAHAHFLKLEEVRRRDMDRFRKVWSARSISHARYLEELEAQYEAVTAEVTRAGHPG